MSCSFAGGKAVEVCVTDEIARYTFGQIGQTPDLALSLRFGNGAEFVPWPGAGSSIWESIRLTNNNAVYEVYGGFSRGPSAEDADMIEVSPAFGGIYVEDTTGIELAHLECISGTVDYAF